MTENERARRADIVADRWPYGPNVNAVSRAALLDWAEATGYRLATPKARCLHWLVGRARHCSARQDRYEHAGRVDHTTALDHLTFWTRDRRPALILGQPYARPADEWVTRVLADWPVDIEITEQAPWYGHGTLGVLITPRAGA